MLWPLLVGCLAVSFWFVPASLRFWETFAVPDAFWILLMLLLTLLAYGVGYLIGRLVGNWLPSRIEVTREVLLLPIESNGRNKIYVHRFIYNGETFCRYKVKNQYGEEVRETFDADVNSFSIDIISSDEQPRLYEMKKFSTYPAFRMIGIEGQGVHDRKFLLPEGGYKRDS